MFATCFRGAARVLVLSGVSQLSPCGRFQSCPGHVPIHVLVDTPVEKSPVLRIFRTYLGRRSFPFFRILHRRRACVPVTSGVLPRLAPTVSLCHDRPGYVPVVPVMLVGPGHAPVMVGLPRLCLGYLARSKLRSHRAESRAKRSKIGAMVKGRLPETDSRPPRKEGSLH